MIWNLPPSAGHAFLPGLPSILTRWFQGISVKKHSQVPLEKSYKSERQLLFYLLGFPLYNFSVNPEVVKNMSPLCFFIAWVCTGAMNGEVFAKALSEFCNDIKMGWSLGKRNRTSKWELGNKRGYELENSSLILYFCMCAE